MKEELKLQYDCGDDMAKTNETPSVVVFDNVGTTVPKFTIAIPTYKRVDLLRFAINSCLKQEAAPEFDILVVDNNPERDDETERLMLSEYDKTGIRYFKNTANLGMAGNWNKLYLLARTEWVVMLHDDDMLYPDFLRNMANVIAHDSEASCIYNCYVSINNETDEQPQRKREPIRVTTLIEKDFITGCHLHAPLGMTLKRDVAIQLGGFCTDYYPSLDYHFHVKLTHCYTARWLRGYPLATYRWLVNASGKEQTLFGWVEKDNAIKRLIARNNPSLLLRLCLSGYLKVYDYKYMLNWYGERKTEKTKQPLPIFHLPYYLVKFVYGRPKHKRKFYTLDAI